jgi:hypothetical protein
MCRFDLQQIGERGYREYSANFGGVAIKRQQNRRLVGGNLAHRDQDGNPVRTTSRNARALPDSGYRNARVVRPLCRAVDGYVCADDRGAVSDLDAGNGFAGSRRKHALGDCHDRDGPVFGRHILCETAPDDHCSNGDRNQTHRSLAPQQGHELFGAVALRIHRGALGHRVVAHEPDVEIVLAGVRRPSSRLLARCYDLTLGYRSWWIGRQVNVGASSRVVVANGLLTRRRVLAAARCHQQCRTHEVGSHRNHRAHPLTVHNCLRSLHPPGAPHGSR